MMCGHVTARLSAPRQSPMSAGTFLVVGGVYIDELHAVSAYPKEDSTQRSLSVTRRRGGNAGNTSCVVAQLATNWGVKWMGVLPAPGAGDDEGVAYVLEDFRANGVDARLAERIQPKAGERLGVPTATIIVSEATGSRTIISSRRGLNCEISLEWFGVKLPELVASTRSRGWVHLETRDYDSVIRLAKEARRVLDHHANVAAADLMWKLSIEIEKPALTLAQVIDLASCADVIFFSRDWAERRASEVPPAAGGAGGAGSEAEHTAVRIMRHVARAVEDRGHVLRALVCAWGAEGAYALAPPAGATGLWMPSFAPAVAVEEVVDSTGAGDTFNAAVITSLAAGADVAEAIGDACAVAGAKVGQHGFGGLAGALTESRRKRSKRAREEGA